MLPESTDTPGIEPASVEPVPAPSPELPDESAQSLAPQPVMVREPFWHYSDVVLFVGLSLAALIAIGIFIRLFSGGKVLQNPPSTLLLILQLLLYVVFYGVGRLIFALRYNKPLFASLGWRRTHFNLAVTALSGAALAFLVSLIASALKTPKITTPIDQLVDSRFSFVLFAITAIVVAPFFEEFLFRGLLQPLFSRTFGLLAGILLTAALFGFAHGYEYAWAWQYILAIFIAGAAFGIARARANSIVPPVIMHCCYNTVFLIAFAVTKHGKFS